MTRPLEGQVALVTGGSRGLGRLLVEALALAGVRVAVAGRSADRMQATVDAVRRAGGQVLPVTCDVSDAAAVARAVREATDAFGAIDLLVNNAGEGGPIGDAWTVDTAAWWRTFEVNLLGSYLCSREVLPAMVGRRQGVIVNLASHAGVERWPSCSAYAVSKAALIKLTENLAAEIQDHDVSVFAFHPGILTVGMGDAQRYSSLDAISPAQQRIAAWFRHQIAEGRTVDAQHSVAALMELVSGRYRVLSGCYLTVADDFAALAADADRGGRGFRRLRLSR
jgi:NAD(P)-dependent dehydrogenase (short-subunit alcohol dehydrogenase family)